MLNNILITQFGLAGVIIGLAFIFLFGSALGTATLGVGVSTTIQLTYLPQFLTFVTTAAPQSLRVSVLGDGVTMDLDAAGLTQMNAIEMIGLGTNQYTYQLADGIVKGKNVEVTFINATAAAVILYGYSKLNALNYFVYQRQTILAASGVDLDKFAALAITAPGATDIFNITYRSGISDSNLTLNEIRDDVGFFQNNVGVFLINNFDQRVKKVNIIPAAQRTAYLMKFAAIADIENAPVTRS